MIEAEAALGDEFYAILNGTEISKAQSLRIDSSPAFSLRRTRPKLLRSMANDRAIIGYLMRPSRMRSRDPLGSI